MFGSWPQLQVACTSDSEVLSTTPTVSDSQLANSQLQLPSVTNFFLSLPADPAKLSNWLIGVPGGGWHSVPPPSFAMLTSLHVHWSWDYSYIYGSRGRFMVSCMMGKRSATSVCPLSGEPENNRQQWTPPPALPHNNIRGLTIKFQD